MAPATKKKGRKSNIEPPVPDAGSPEVAAYERAEENEGQSMVVDDGVEASTTGSAKKGRKRAADLFDEPTEKPVTKNESKPTKKPKVVKESKTKPSKEDGHPIEVVKVQPGGDKMEVEPAEVSKTKKSKTTKSKPEVTSQEGDVIEKITEKVTETVTEKTTERKSPRAAPKAKKTENAEETKPETKKTKPKGKKAETDKATSDKVGEVAASSVSDATKAGAEGAEKVKDTVSKAKPAAKKAKAKQTTKDVTSDAQETGQAVVDSAIEQAGNAATAARDTAEDVATKVSKATKKGKAKAKDSVDVDDAKKKGQDTADSAVATAGKLANQAQESAEQVAVKGKKAAKKTKEGIQESVNVDDVKAKGQEIVDSAVTVGGDVAEKAATKSKKAVKKTKAVANKAGEALQAGVEIAQDSMDVDGVKAKGQDILDSTVATSGNVTGQLQEGAAKAATKVKKAASKTKAVASDAGEALQNGTEATKDAASKAVGATKADQQPKSKKVRPSKVTNEQPGKPDKDHKSPVEDAMTKVSPAGAKRKAPTATEAEATTNASEGTPAKKQKKGKTAAGRVSDVFNTGIQAASDGLNAVISSINGLSGQKSLTDDVAEVAADASGVPAKGKKTAKGKKAEAKDKKASSSNNAVETSAVETFDGFAEDDDEDNQEDFEADDQTVALLKGFESDEDGEESESGDEGFKEGVAIPKLPKAKDLAKKLKAVKGSGENEPGVVYIGHIPHGFHEHEMRAYFSQFGSLNHVRLSRSKKTGNSKHYGFLEFESAAVAKIAADTMDKYLLFGHILKCKVVPKEQVPDSLWKGADKRFKKVPWSKIEGRKLAMPQGEEVWQKRAEKETKKRQSKQEKMKAIGYEYEVPTLKDAADVVREKAKAGDRVEEERTTVVSGGGKRALVVSEEVTTTKKPRKGKAKTETTSGAETSVLSEVADKATEVAETAKELVQNGVEKVQEVIAAAEDKVPEEETAKTEVDTAIEKGKKGAKKGKAKAKSVGADAPAGIEDTAHNVAEISTAAVEEGKEKVKKVAKKAKKAGEEELSAVKEGKVDEAKEKKVGRKRKSTGSAAA